jgi:TRAP transporter TAXI family solute receptor
MMQRFPALSWWLAGAGMLGGVFLIAFFARGIAEPASVIPQRVSFQISTASISGSDFSVGETLAGILSHPPGISRCETTNVCGPPGLIVSVRAADGAMANVTAVNMGSTNSGLVQADVVAQAVAGQGPFAASGPAQQLRVIANLYGQALHLVAAPGAGIHGVEDLRGKRVSLSPENSGTIVTARAVLQAFGVPEWRLTRSYETADAAAELLRRGEIDAFFFVAGAPVDLIAELVGEGDAILVPVNGEGRDRLLAAHPSLRADVMAQGVYAGLPAVETVSVGTLWVTNASVPDDLVYAMARAVYNPDNRAAIEARITGSQFLELSNAVQHSPAPFHPGALRYYAEARVIPTPENPVLPVPKP